MPGPQSRAPFTVLVTIHGIGFQVSPADEDRGPNPAGYADALHQYLTNDLGARLSPDPGRKNPDTGEPFGPVYVQSHWPPASDDAKAGLARLNPDKPLRTGDQPLGHVALVYSHLEETTPKPGSFLELCGQALVQHRKYASLGHIARWLWADAAAFRRKPAAGATVTPSPSLELRPRGGPSPAVRRVPILSPQPRSVVPGATDTTNASTTKPRDSVTDMLITLENDFAAYVLRNDLRERVRTFVEDAIVMLAEREDVDAIVINAHSQGTAVAFDVLTTLADAPGKKVQHLITSGSHLRKLVDLFNWGNEIHDMRTGVTWTNFYDACDPVADALGRDEWVPGQHLVPPAWSGPTLFQNRPVTDVEVWNVDHTTGTGLRAHNYFDNVEDWIPQVANVLRAVAKLPAPVTEAVRTRRPSQ